uniref:Uncharacterized protein n=1 Tax=Anguilla anguilla TaxID=7936 RepID=A0A0E9PAX3_ANGAN
MHPHPITAEFALGIRANLRILNISVVKKKTSERIKLRARI